MLNAKITSPGIDIVEVQPRLAAVVRKSVTFADMGKAQRAARGALDSALKAATAQPLGALTLWQMAQGGLVDYAPGVFVSDGFAASGEISLFTLPQGRAAHLRMVGGYEGLPRAWQSLFESCAEQQLELGGLNWEIYGSPDTAPDLLATDLYALLA